MPPKSDGILESSLYVTDVVRSVRFYEETFGFRVITEFGKRGCAMCAGMRQVLLLFEKGGSRTIQSPHDGDGELHMRSRFPRMNWPTGNCGCRPEESLWKKRAVGTGRLERLLQRP